mgnify:CR=1 FL=1
MSLYNQESNKDNVVLRYVLIALLSDLKNRVYYYNLNEDDSYKKIDIPFYYSLTGSERFLLDNFLYSAIEDGKAIGDYEVVPRAMLQMSDLGIDSGNMTNKFVLSEFVKEFDGNLKTFNLNTNFLPINISLNTEIICSNNLEMLKVTETIISKMYKSTVYQVDLGMMRIEASYQIPEDYSQDKLFEFSIDDKKEFKVTFPIQLQFHLPVFEHGILLSEIIQLISGDTDKGVGMYRDGKIKFGGIIETFEIETKDLSLKEKNNIQSNKNGKNKTIESGKIYSIDDLEPKIEEESKESKDWRNK